MLNQNCAHTFLTYTKQWCNFTNAVMFMGGMKDYGQFQNSNSFVL